MRRALFLILLACCSREETLDIGRIETGDAQGIADLAGAVRGAVERARGYRLLAGKAGASAWSCRAQVISLEQIGENSELLVAVEVELTRGGARREKLRAEGQRIVPLESEAARPAAEKAALASALQEALTRIAAQRAAERRSDRELIAELASPDPRLRDAAVQALAGRKNPAAVPALIARLKDEDPQIVLATIGALVEIGDRRAVVPIIELARGREAEMVVQLAYAVSQLGGPEAEAWLFTQAQGAEDAKVRGAAVQASRELRERADAGPRSGR